MLEQLVTAMEEQDAASAFSREALDICAGYCTASHIFGVVADPTGDFNAVQSIMKLWNDGEVLPTQPKARIQSVGQPSLWIYPSNNDTEPQRRSYARDLNPRAECRSIRVDGGDTCPSLATRCGIGLTALKSFNSGTPDFCNNIEPGDAVCCSSGTPPVVGPGPNPDGSCKYHEVQQDEICPTIAAIYEITTADLYDFNKETWGWDGCALPIGLRICVSEGFPPLPASVWNADCGPTVSGTEPPQEGDVFAEMNPCPLDVCCNIWGKCGTTVDFCILLKSETGNPGTSAPGENGCIDNCGMEMVNNDEPPELYRKIGYFEGWNYDRPCLNMHVDDILDGYTHVYFGFGEFSSDLKVIIKDNHQEQWNAFLKADRDYRKILFFGGWEFSNAPSISGLFRLAVSPNNRDIFAENVVKFAVDNGLDGLDFDWEYPGVTDIEGSEPGQDDDGENYLEFLKLVREKLSDDMTVFIATAAFFWYLKGFPVKDMAPVVDCFIYMVYDLYGQWDVGREWSMEGCLAGNCLRSHINFTQTYGSLTMMTKAGVPSHKVVVGVTSYGRLFKMADATCRGPLCTFLGERNDSPATPGRCTETGGYISNFEINEIIEEGGAIKSWYDEGTDSDYLVYDSVEALTAAEGRRANTGDPVYLDPIVYQEPDAWCEPPCVLVFLPSQLPSPTTIDPGKYTMSLLYGRTTETTSYDEVVTVFVTQATIVILDLPVITIDEVSYSNVNISRHQDTSSLWVGVSIPIGPVTVSLDDGESGKTTRVLSLPAWPAVTQGPPVSGDVDDDDEDWEFLNPIQTTAELEPFEPAPTTLPTWRIYPSYVVEPVTEEDGGGGDDDDDDHDGAGVIITSCKLWFFNTESAELCSTTVTELETLVGTITSTVTATSAACETIYGCSLTDWESTTTTTAPVCERTSSSGEYQPPAIGCPAPAIIYPKDSENVGSIPSLLQEYDDYVEDTMDALKQSPDVLYAYYYEETNYNIGMPVSREEQLLDWDLSPPVSEGDFDSDYWTVNEKLRLDKRQKIEDWEMIPKEKVISQLIDTVDDVKRKNRQGKACINMSFFYPPGAMVHSFHIMFRNLLQKLDQLGVVVVVTANNHAEDIFNDKGELVEEGEGIPVSRYPALLGDPDDMYGGFPNMIVVSASDWKTERAQFAQYSPWVTAFAPGINTQCPGDPIWDDGETIITCSGTSYAAPQVAALVGYYRSLPSPWQSQLDKPSNVKKLIQLFARRFAVHGHNVDPLDRRPIIWNGQVGEHSCLREYGSTEDWAKVCPTIKDNLEDEPDNPGQSVESCAAGQNGNPLKCRQSDGGGGDSCPIVPGDQGPGKTIDWEEGPSGPECAADDHCGGELCKGYYCDPDPEIPHPPDYYDPKDPANPHGQPAPEPTATTTSTPPTQTPDPPVDTVFVCVARTIEASYVSEYTSFGHAVYLLDDPCNGKGIGIGSINGFPEICDIANGELTSNNICDFDMTFVNQGPEFWGKCGFEISIDGKQYTPHELDPESENNFCSGLCELQKQEGLLYYELPVSACFNIG
ncbi:hypothetical protein FE257_005339 [Aspergillus nanangensis]|uniref:chitinase n=1 Tax=Aspergillus nanangensis TaxID=2582783 RepID=A0AAD4CA90_ASPNN|nr:hypothetical protein FE257_005339 [Aspergillus nanangensis]